MEGDGFLAELSKVKVSAYKNPWEQTITKNETGIDLPGWAFDRPHLTANYLQSSEISGRDLPSRSYNSLSSSTKEYAILEDVLDILTGVDGQYVRMFGSRDEKDVSFELDPSIDSSTREIIERITKISGHYIQLERFVVLRSRYEHGRVTHAFSAAISSYLKEYLVLIAQLEHQLREGQLSLQKMWFYIQPMMQTIDTLHDITKEVTDQRGGMLLNLLYSKLTLQAGNTKTVDMIKDLLTTSCVPLFEMLEEWIYWGKINDPHREFFIQEHLEMEKENLNEDYNDEYWEQRYTLKQEQLPTFLSKYSERILVTGKYLSVIHECGLVISQRNPLSFTFSPNDRDYQDRIDQAYSFASKILLDLLMKEKQLVPRLRSIKHYFMLDQGDFFEHFMELATEELRKNITEISPMKLHSLLELSLRTSVADQDPFKDDLTCVLLPYNLLIQLMKIINVASEPNVSQKSDPLTGLQGFTFDYKVNWPLSLVISRKSLTKSLLTCPDTRTKTRT
eukprot:TRINITY_DN9459_c0_g1_i1.p1 TRINITY_DN9459_c0_g1~~TRINITY_DN9459_c0_g1_i1.p1  ORF type:complete len:506 (+),score=121.48 TRINITY_DN9459_c0_g1_i1:102-1619(+)